MQPQGEERFFTVWGEDELSVQKIGRTGFFPNPALPMLALIMQPKSYFNDVRDRQAV